MITLHRRLALRIRDLYSGYLWNRNPPEVGAFHRDIPYVHGGGRRQSLDVVVPTVGGPYPVLLYLHGGGWRGGDKKSTTRICKCFARDGLLVFNANYRLAPRHGLREQVKDVADAVRWARDNAARYGGDPERFVIGGESAGAHLASLYAAAARDGRLSEAFSLGQMVPPDLIKGLLLFYGVYDLESALRSASAAARAAVSRGLGEEWGASPESLRLASPIAYVGSGYPPAFICSGEEDDIHEQSVLLEASLGSAGVGHRVMFFPRDAGNPAPHGFLAVYTLESSRAAMRAALEFVREVTGMDVRPRTR